MLALNLDPATSVVGVELKLLIGAIFAEIAGEKIRDAIAYARGDDTAAPAGSPAEAAALALGPAASYSPETSTVEGCRESGLSPAAVVEIITWLSVLQMLHRLTCYLTAGD